MSYIRYQDNLEKGDIIFTYDNRFFMGWISELIYSLTKTDDDDVKVSHVAMYIGDGLIIESIAQGVSIHSLKSYKLEDYDLYVGRVKTTKEIKEKVCEYTKVQAEKVGYSYIQLIVLLFKKIFKKIFKTAQKTKDYDKKNTTCAELVTEAYKQNGVVFFSKLESADVDASILFKNPLMTIIPYFIERD